MNKQPCHLRNCLSVGSAALVLALASVALAAVCLFDGAGTAWGADKADEPASTAGILLSVEESPVRAFSASASSDLEEDLAAIGIELGEPVDVADGETWYAAEPVDGQSDAEAAREAAKLPGVVSAQPNYVYELVDAPIEATSAAEPAATRENITPLAALRANDPYAAVSNPYPSTRPNQYWLYNSKLIDAWDEVVSDGKVTVAVMDAVVLPTHRDLAANMLTKYAWDATTGRAMDFSSETNYLANSGHGTMVSGIVSGVANNGLGIAGSSYNASILPVRVFTDQGKSSTLYLRRAFEYVLGLKASGALPDLRVINMSLGSYNDAVKNDTVLHDYIRKARNQYGIVTVCAGGNGEIVDGQRVPLTKPCYPADFEECVAVTSLSPEGTNTYWSDYNKAKDIGAPGEGIWSTYPSNTNGYAAASGSSASSPIVAGTFALMFAAVPNATVDEACAALYATATPIVDKENDRTHTSGSHGALDAAAAVTYLKEHHPWQFVDVPKSAWFYQPVGFVAERGILNGYADGSGKFGATDIMTREQAASMLYNYLGHGAKAPAAPQRDVSQKEWYAAGVNWAVSTGVMNGYNQSDFGVGDKLTREQAACIIANVAHADLDAASSAKYDALQGTNQTSDWAEKSLIWAVDKGVLNGVANSDGTRSLAPQAYVTRAQMAGIMKNAIEGGLL